MSLLNLCGIILILQTISRFAILYLFVTVHNNNFLVSVNIYLISIELRNCAVVYGQKSLNCHLERRVALLTIHYRKRMNNVATLQPLFQYILMYRETHNMHAKREATTENNVFLPRFAKIFVRSVEKITCFYLLFMFCLYLGNCPLRKTVCDKIRDREIYSCEQF